MHDESSSQGSAAKLSFARWLVRWWGALPSEGLLSVLMLVLLALATASFLIYEKGVAHTFGMPLDGGWLDLAVGRSLFSSSVHPAASASESPGYALFLGALDALARQDTAQVVLAAKLLSLVALSLVGWGCLKLVRAIPGTGPFALLGIALMLPLSPTLVWMGVSGAGLAWGVALVTLGLVAFAYSRPIKGTLFMGLSLWATPGALVVLLGTFVATRERWGARALAAAVFLLPYAAWNLFVSGWSSPFPGGAFEFPSFWGWTVWMRHYLRLIGLTFVGGAHPMLLAAFAALGVWRVRRNGRLLWLAAVLPALVLGFLLPEPGVFGRLLFVSLPAIFVLAAVGVEYVAAQVTTGFLSGGRLALVLLAFYMLISGPSLWQMRCLSAWQVENTVQVGEKAGVWLAEHALRGEVIVTTAPGAISYFSGHPVLDLTRRPIRRLPLEQVLESVRAPWVALNIGGVLPAVLRERYTAETSVSFRVHAGVYPPGPFVVFRRTYGQSYASYLPSVRERSTVRSTLRELSSASR